MSEDRGARRVVITGVGALTPCGNDAPATWAAVRDGRSGIGPITLFDPEPLSVKIAGEVSGFDAALRLGARQARRTDRFVQLALCAALEAIDASKLSVDPGEAYDVGVIVGCGCGGIWTYEREVRGYYERGPRAISPLLVPRIVPDAASVAIALVLGARGPNLGVVSACATSLDAIGHAYEMLRRGDAQVMVAGGSEAAVHPLGIAGFDRLGALSRRNDDPAGASRPFDVDRDGFVLSEGAVVLVLETLEHARARGAEPLAELRGYASTSDAVHLTAPDPTGAGAAECMRRALARAELEPTRVDYVCAHAPGTLLGDPIESAAIRSLFGAHTDRLLVSATKSATGHLLGAAGALAVFLTAQALSEGQLPPTLNLREPDPSCDLSHVTAPGKATGARVALVPSYGFGGHNSCVVVQAFPG